MIESLLAWFCFSVLLSLMPVVFNGYRAWVDASREVSLAAFGRGELLLLAAALCATGAERVFTLDGGPQPARTIFGSLAILGLVSCAMLFADMSAPGRRPRLTNTTLVVRISIIMYLLAVIVGGACVAIAED